MAAAVSRVSVPLTSPQDAYLRAEAERLGVSIAEVIRRIIDSYRESKSK
jgi:hypothetical protein